MDIQSKRINDIVNYHLARLETMPDYSFHPPKKKSKPKRDGNGIKIEQLSHEDRIAINNLFPKKRG